jgi:2'-5' RNA ligase
MQAMKISPIDLHSEAIRESRKHPLLVALAFLSKDLLGPVIEVQEHLRKLDSRHIYHPSNTLHITIKPMGSLGGRIKQQNLSKILDNSRKVASEAKAFDVTLQGLACFPDVLYAKIVEGRREIVQLNKSLAKNLKGMVDQDQYEGDQMVPHVTLATFTTSDVRDLLKEVRRANQLKIGKMTVEKIVVVKAYLHRYYGPERERANSFEKIAEFPLNHS